MNKMPVNYYGTVCYLVPLLDKYGNIRIVLEDANNVYIQDMLDATDGAEREWNKAKARTKRDYNFLLSVDAITEFDPDLNNDTYIADDFLKKFDIWEESKEFHDKRDEYWKSIPEDDSYEWGLEVDPELGKPNFVQIYEPNDNNPCMFSELNEKWFVYVNSDMYRKKFERPLVKTPEKLDAFMESLFKECNTNHPVGYYGYSLSVGDVIVFNQNKSLQAFYVNDCGFENVTNFWKKDYYSVSIREILERMVIIPKSDTVQNEEQAVKEAEKMYINQDVILDDSDLKEVNYIVEMKEAI